MEKAFANSRNSQMSDDEHKALADYLSVKADFTVKCVDEVIKIMKESPAVAQVALKLYHGANTDHQD